MKKMSIILLAAALCFAAGCTGTGNQPEESSAQSTVSDTENNTPQSSSNPENSNTESSNPESSSYQEGVPESATVTEVTDKDGNVHKVEGIFEHEMMLGSSLNNLEIQSGPDGGYVLSEDK